MIGPKGEGKVFKSFKATMTQYPLKDWLKTAGIKKHITFHSFRHTFASLQLELGTDIYTVQSLLAHKSVTTTQIYARHADPKRREAANRMSFEVLNDVSESKNESSETGTSDE
jgi:integrase